MLLDGATVPAGNYEWMRLKVNAEPNVDDSYIAFNAGERCELRVPSGAESGLKLIRGFTVGVGGVTDMTIDFNLRKSIVQPPGQRSDADHVRRAGVPAQARAAGREQPAGRHDQRQCRVEPVAAACPTSTATPGKVYLYGPYSCDRHRAAARRPDDEHGGGRTPSRQPASMPRPTTPIRSASSLLAITWSPTRARRRCDGWMPTPRRVRRKS